jgi:hypothetical protein
MMVRIMASGCKSIWGGVFKRSPPSIPSPLGIVLGLTYQILRGRRSMLTGQIQIKPVSVISSGIAIGMLVEANRAILTTLVISPGILDYPKRVKMEV